MNAPATQQQMAYAADQRDCAVEDLRKILALEIVSEPSEYTGMTNVLDMLAGIAEERSKLEGDKWERIGQAIAKLATVIEHHIPDDPKDDDEAEYSGVTGMTEDQRLDDPRHGQARFLNRVIG